MLTLQISITLSYFFDSDEVHFPIYEILVKQNMHNLKICAYDDRGKKAREIFPPAAHFLSVTTSNRESFLARCFFRDAMKRNDHIIMGPFSILLLVILSPFMTS